MEEGDEEEEGPARIQVYPEVETAKLVRVTGPVVGTDVGKTEGRLLGDDNGAEVSMRPGIVKKGLLKIGGGVE